MQQHTVIAPNKVGKHRHFNTQCVSSEQYLFSSKYLCKQKLWSKSKSEKENKKGTAYSDTYRSTHVSCLI